MVQLLLFLLLLAPSCSSLDSKSRLREAPIHNGPIVDPYINGVLTEFFRVSTEKHIVFTQKVTIGLVKIPELGVIGICHYGKDFREIDLDVNFWKKSSWETKISALLHELAHCYCDRDHDYGSGIKYPGISLIEKMAAAIRPNVMVGNESGYFPQDGCPVSLLHPIIVNDICLKMHYNEYVNEIFNRCDPW